MLKPDRLRSLMETLGLSQSELGRRVGVSQATIYKLLTGETYGSKHLHRIARVLGTTPEYLAGEIDDPDLGAAPPLPQPPPGIFLRVELPAEEALAVMFEALLDGIDSAAPRAEQALLLAQRLPIGLSQLVDARPAPLKKARRVPEPAGSAASRPTPGGGRRL